MKYKARFSLSVLATFALCLPVMAQSQISSNQPVCGQLHARECNLQSKLKNDYEAGRIDSTELASFQRDLDGIMVKENNYKSRNDGLTSGGRDHLLGRIDVLEAKLDRHARKSMDRTAYNSRVDGSM